MIVGKLTEVKSQPLFYHLDNFVEQANVFLKLEGLNLAGSIKLKPAIWLVEQLEKQKKLIPGYSTAICSSSGNLGIALSIVCKEKNYPFICVSDLNISPISEKYIELFDGELIKVDKRDANNGYLGSRLSLIKNLLEQNKNYVFIDQYSNSENVSAHYSTTAEEIKAEFPVIDYLFVGAGTTGTLMGCAKYFKQFSPATKIIAVDAVGSVTFGFAPSKRYIPGLGTSCKPDIADKTFLDDIVMVEELDTITMCHYMLEKHGLLLGGSSGTVLQGLKQYSATIKSGATIVAISPDFGDRYLSTIYDEAWVRQRF